MSDSYRLTSHPSGTIGEVWAMSWPLMITIASGSLMFFADRLYLAHYSVEAMNALAIGGIWSFFLLVIPFSVCEITEVFVGKYNGAQNKNLTARPVWQMLWLSFFIAPFLVLGSYMIAHGIFDPKSLQADYLTTFICFSPMQLAAIAISGFFIATGRVKVITYAHIAANILNVLLAPLFIFTFKLGIQGAAFASGISFLLLSTILALFFLSKKNRAEFKTDLFAFDYHFTKEMLSVALPSGLGRAVEVLAHCGFFTIMAASGFETLTAVTFVQSFYLLCCFVIDAISKGTTAIVSNLIGAKQEKSVLDVLRSACLLHAMVSIIIALFGYFSIETVLQMTLTTQDMYLLYDKNFLWSVKVAMCWMSLFFLLDGYVWILGGHLTARSDTKFLLYASLATNWLTYLLPIYLLATYVGIGSAGSWAIIAFNSFVLCIVYALRTKKQLQLRTGTALSFIAQK